jgi:hypothetical protein
MHKNTYANVPTLSAIAISAILLTSFTMVGMQLSQHALAQNATSAAPTNATSAAPTNATSAAPSAAPSTNNTAAQEPAVGQSFVWQGTKSSQESPLASQKKDQVAAILIPRSDGAVYSGVLTFSTSKGGNVEIWHEYNPGNTSALGSKTFGSLKTDTFQGKQFALTDLSGSGTSASVPFSGNALLLHAKSPFTVTYTVNAVAQPAKTINNVQTAMAAAPPAAPKTLSSGNSTSGSSGGSGSSSSKSSSTPQPTTLS